MYLEHYNSNFVYEIFQFRTINDKQTLGSSVSVRHIIYNIFGMDESLFNYFTAFENSRTLSHLKKI